MFLIKRCNSRDSFYLGFFVATLSVSVVTMHQLRTYITGWYIVCINYYKMYKS